MNNTSKSVVVTTKKIYSEKDRLAQLVGSETLAIRLLELGITVEKLTSK